MQLLLLLCSPVLPAYALQGTKGLATATAAVHLLRVLLLYVGAFANDGGLSCKAPLFSASAASADTKIAT